ncbi:Fur family transcriptional regulator [Kyrpidia spormannii]|uniref:ferric iron uptake transcriptional regulator n=1 Tax=Kyrpidia spormannii TaxID=2055160 RepID=UPI001474C972
MKSERRTGGAGVEERLADRLQQIKKLLHAEQLKLTPQREATLRVLLENQEAHLSAEEVFMLVKHKAPDIGLATVYRTLELLVDLRIIEKLNFGDGVARYEFRERDQPHHHHHLICLDCGKVSEIEDLLGDLERSIETRHRFRIVDHRVSFLGYCRECQEKTKTEGTALPSVAKDR